MVTSRPELHLRPVSGFMALLQPGSSVISLALIITKDSGDVWGLACHLKPWWCPRAMLQLCYTDLRGLFYHLGGMNIVISGPRLLPKVTHGSMVLLQLGSVLVSVAYVTTGGHRNHM